MILQLILFLMVIPFEFWVYAIPGHPIGYYSSNIAQNITTSVGKTVYLNCSLTLLSSDKRLVDLFDYSKYSPYEKSGPTSSSKDVVLMNFNPTWLKADYVYNQNGGVESHRTENIIVTRKGVIADGLRGKIKLIQPSPEERIQVLELSDLEIRDEGKYICRELSANIDRAFYVSIFSPIRELSLKFYSPSKYFREIFTNNRETFETIEGVEDRMMIGNTAGRQLIYSSNTVSIRESDELLITCTVNSSKPAAALSIWVHKRPTKRRRSLRSSSSSERFNSLLSEQFPNRFSGNDESEDQEPADSRRLDPIDSHITKNNDLTLKAVLTSKFVVSRTDNHRFVACVGENPGLNEKWETKRILNVLYGPKCSKYQRTVFNTGINQTIDLECHMTDANPPYLDFTWTVLQHNHMASTALAKERIRTTGFTSRVSFTPRSHKDFGDIACRASNGLDPISGSGECKMRVELGGPPEPPFDCYHKENNRTIIIECKPGFDQGDPEVYFYLLKRKSNGVLTEYARKRDSCSFLISNLILEEYSNDFFIYSSNKYGTNRERAVKLTIVNQEFMNKNGFGSSDWESAQSRSSKQLTYLVCTAFVFAMVFLIVCCLLMRCKRSQYHQQKKYSSSSLHHNGGYNQGHMHFQYSAPMGSLKHKEVFKYYNGSVNGSIKQNGHLIDERFNEKEYFGGSGADSSSNDHYEKEDFTGVYDNNSYKRSYSKLNDDNIRSPSLINNIQDLDSSPRSKRRSLEKSKENFGCSRSLVDETTETDSENYVEFNRTKIRESQILIDSNCEQNEKLEPQSLKQQGPSSHVLPKVSVWYSSTNKPVHFLHHESSPETPENDNYSGISVDNPKPIISSQTLVTSKMEKNWNIMEYSKSFKQQTQNQPTASIFKPVAAFGVPSIINRQKHHSPPSINEYIDDQVEEEELSDSTTNTGSNTDNKLSGIFKWQKTKQLISNETISMNVDDEKAEGILV